MGKAYEIGLDVERKRLTPHERRRSCRRRLRRWDPNAAHARTSRVTRTYMGWLCRNDLSDACRAIAEAARQELEVGKLVVNCLGELDSAFIMEAKGFLEMREHAPAARDGKGHAAKFAEQLVPLLGCDAATTTEQIEELMDAFQAMRRELDGPPNCINQPAEDSFEGRPARIAFEHFLDGGRFLARIGVGGVKRPKDVIQGT
jgi:hypothetical protein